MKGEAGARVADGVEVKVRARGGDLMSTVETQGVGVSARDGEVVKVRAEKVAN